MSDQLHLLQSAVQGHRFRLVFLLRTMSGPSPVTCSASDDTSLHGCIAVDQLGSGLEDDLTVANALGVPPMMWALAVGHSAESGHESIQLLFEGGHLLVRGGFGSDHRPLAAQGDLHPHGIIGLPIEINLENGPSADDQWGDPTPCPEWTVRDLVNHITNENLWIPPLLAGETVEAVGTRFDGDVLGDDPDGSAEKAARATLTAVADSPTDGTVNTSAGDVPRENYIVQLAFENLIHGWDLAAATKGDRSFDSDLVGEMAIRFNELEGDYRASGGIAPRAPFTGEAQTDLLARFGRQSSWGPNHVTAAGFGAAMEEVFRTPGLQFSVEETFVCGDRRCPCGAMTGRATTPVTSGASTCSASAMG